MKKLTIAFALIALLTVVLAINAFGAENGNIAPDAILTTDSGHWHVVGNGGWAKDCIPYLVDGDYSTGIPSTCAGIKWDNHHFKYGQPVQVGSVVLHVNGSGVRGNIDNVSNINIATDYYVILYDANGKELSSMCQNAKDKTELIFEYESPIEATYIKVAYWAGYSTESAYLREVEIFNHTCLFNTLKETIKQPTCIDNGIGLYECSCGKTEEQPLLATGEHIYTDIDALTYENGFLANGKKLFGCPTCDDYIEKEELPIFKFLGYSLSHSGKSICAGYVVDKDILDEYTKINSITIDYGMLFAVTDQADIVNPNATLKENINGNIMSLINEDYSRFDIRITANDWTNILDTPLVMCCYVVEGEKVTYICSNTNTDGAIPISYNHLNFMPI